MTLHLKYQLPDHWENVYVTFTAINELWHACHNTKLWKVFKIVGKRTYCIAQVYQLSALSMGWVFPRWHCGKESTYQCRRCKRHWFDPWIMKIPLAEEMATHSSILAWRTQWTEGPGRLHSIGSQTVGHDWSNIACTDGMEGDARLVQEGGGPCIPIAD